MGTPVTHNPKPNNPTNNKNSTVSGFAIIILICAILGGLVLYLKYRKMDKKKLPTLKKSSEVQSPGTPGATLEPEPTLEPQKKEEKKEKEEQEPEPEENDFLQKIEDKFS